MPGLKYESSSVTDTWNASAIFCFCPASYRPHTIVTPPKQLVVFFDDLVRNLLISAH